MESLAGENTLNFSSLRVKVQGTRMSGDMCTSLGNGFSNLMLMKFWAFKHGVTVDGVVEGDDGLFVFNRDVGCPDKEFFESMGFKLKIDCSEDLGAARFCSMVFSPETCHVLSDPVKVMLNLGWTFSEARFSEKARKQLLRAKGMSLMCQSPGCPVLHSFSKYVLRVTEGCGVRFSGVGGVKDIMEQQTNYERLDEYKQMDIVQEDRDLVWREFGVPITRQLEIENYFDHCTELKPIPLHLLIDFVTSDMLSYYSYHCYDVSGSQGMWKR